MSLAPDTGATPNAHQQAAGDVLTACQALSRIRDNAELSAEDRLYCLRCVRRNLAAYEDHLASQDAAGGAN